MTRTPGWEEMSAFVTMGQVCRRDVRQLIAKFDVVWAVPARVLGRDDDGP